VGAGVSRALPRAPTPERNAGAAGLVAPEHPGIIDVEALRWAEARGNFVDLVRLARFVGLRASGRSGEIAAACDRQRQEGWGS
jgi:hypothetical protein